MIRVILRGRLGNWLFQYAAGRRLATLRGTDLCLDLSNRRTLRDWKGAQAADQLSCFPLQATLSGGAPVYGRLRRALGLGGHFREGAWGFDPALLDLPDGSRLFGYFQSERYFADMAPQIREELTPRLQAADPPARRLADAMAAIESVAVHVRRGDYLKLPSHNVCTATYYVRAVKAVRDRVANPRFFVFSDDIAWCRANLGIDGAEFVDLHGAAGQPVLDLWLMSRCRHQIIANSTFSWWGAWLNSNPDKMVAAPSRWFREEAMNAPALRDTVPASWQRVEVD